MERQKVMKLGTKSITREGSEYELTVNFLEFLNAEASSVSFQRQNGIVFW
jgi:hypothetical protein